MTKEQPPVVDFTTPRIVFGYTVLNEPDQKYNKYSVDWRLRPEEFPADVMAKIVEIRDELVTSTKKAFLASKSPFKADLVKTVPILREEVDKLTGKPTGFVIVKASLVASVTAKRGPNIGKTFTFRPELYDASGAEMKNSPRIFSGSEGFLHILAQPYFFPGDKNEVGVKWKLVGAQIVKVGDRQARSATSHGFQPQEGYVEGQEAAREPGSDDADGDDDSIPY